MAGDTTTTEKPQADLLAGTENQAEQGLNQEQAATNEGEQGENENAETQTAQLDEKQVTAIQDAAVDSASSIAQYREDANYLLKQMETIDASQFDKGGLYDGLQALQMGNQLIYTLSNEEIERNVGIIEASDLSPQEKRQRIRMIDNALILFKERKSQMTKILKNKIAEASTQEWQQVELSFTDEKKGIPGIKKFIPEIWEFCKNQMESSPSLKARCADSIQEKVKLTHRAIKELGIDKKLSNGDSENERTSVGVPAGNAGRQPAKRGSQEPTFTRAQLRDLQKRPGMVDSALLAKINKAASEGRIQE